MEKNKLTSDFETKRKLDLFGSYPQRILDILDAWKKQQFPYWQEIGMPLEGSLYVHVCQEALY